MTNAEPFDPYRPPEAPIGEAVVEAHPGADPETIRQAYAYREAAVRALGRTCYLFSTLLILLSLDVGLFFRELSQPGNRRMQGNSESELMVLFVASEVLAVLFGLAGYGLVRLRSWAWWLGLVALGWPSVWYLGISIMFLVQRRPDALPAIAIGFVMYGPPTLVLGLLISNRGRMVFTPSYREVVERTPGYPVRLDLRTRILYWLVWTVLGLFAGVLALVLILQLLAR